jgi:hypothetical protein
MVLADMPFSIHLMTFARTQQSALFLFLVERTLETRSQPHSSAGVAKFFSSALAKVQEAYYKL